MKISKHQNTGLGAIFCAAAVIGLAAPTRANELVGPDIAVRYHDLAIDTEQGASQLLKHSLHSYRADMRHWRKRATTKYSHRGMIAIYHNHRLPEL